MRNRGFHGRQFGRLHSKNPDSGIRFFHRAGNAADQPASTDRRDDRLDIRLLLQNFQSQRSLPGDDGIVVESVNQSQMVLAGFA